MFRVIPLYYYTTRSVAEGATEPDTSTPLHHVVGADAEFRECAALVVEGVREAYKGVQVYLAVFEPYVGTFLQNKALVATVTDKFNGDNADLNVLAKTIVKYQVRCDGV